MYFTDIKIVYSLVQVQFLTFSVPYKNSLRVILIIFTNELLL